jgi:hypothetical protein
LLRRRFSRVTVPTEPGRDEAPIRATELGANTLSRLRVDIRGALSQPVPAAH